jgi:hypothetical protein
MADKPFLQEAGINTAHEAGLRKGAAVRQAFRGARRIMDEHVRGPLHQQCFMYIPYATVHLYPPCVLLPLIRDAFQSDCWFHCWLRSTSWRAANPLAGFKNGLVMQ